MKTIVLVFAGIFVLGMAIGVGSVITRGGSSNPEHVEWEENMWVTTSAVNKAGYEPARLILSLSSCETEQACMSAIQKFPVVFKPYSKMLAESLDRMAIVAPPAKHMSLHQAYKRQLELRLEAMNLYISGAERDDHDLLLKGDEVWLEAAKASSAVLDLAADLNK